MDLWTDEEKYNIIRKASCLKEPWIDINDCALWGGSEDASKYPYMYVTLPGRIPSSKISVPRLVHFIHKPDDRYGEPGDVSHRCHQKLCINWTHLTYESHSKNLMRNSCKKQGRCLGHHGGKPCIFGTLRESYLL